MSRILIAIIFSLFIFSCNKNSETDQSAKNNNSQQESGIENDSDSAMTDEEVFSSSLVQGILGEEEDIELQIYLEETIYPIVAKSDKVTFDRISNSIFLLGFNDNGTLRNIMIQKLYNPDTGEFVFENEEVPTSAQKQFVK
jgi:hypothetical protein